MIAVIIIGAILGLGSAAYLYFVYAPVPAPPILGSAIQQKTIVVGIHHRTYLAYIPKKQTNRRGLVIALHGTGMDATRMRQWTGFELDKLADKHGFIVIYPNGYKGNWNDCRKDAPFPANKENIDDVSFIQQLVSTFEAEEHVDLSKVYVFGFSNGGQMALRLAIEQPDMINAVCAVSANLPTPATCSCTFDGPTCRVMLVAGTKDPISPYLGGVVSLFGLKKIGTAMSAVHTTESLARRNLLTNKPTQTKLAHSDGTNDTKVERLTYALNGKPMVELLTVNGGGHAIPQAIFRFPRMMGKTIRNFNSTLEAVKFFGY